jgi:hypothetical protein
MVKHNFVPRPFIDEDDRPTRVMPSDNPFDLGEGFDEEDD